MVVDNQSAAQKRYHDYRAMISSATLAFNSNLKLPPLCHVAINHTRLSFPPRAKLTAKTIIIIGKKVKLFNHDSVGGDREA